MLESKKQHNSATFTFPDSALCVCVCVFLQVCARLRLLSKRPVCILHQCASYVGQEQQMSFKLALSRTAGLWTSEQMQRPARLCVCVCVWESRFRTTDMTQTTTHRQTTDDRELTHTHTHTHNNEMAPAVLWVNTDWQQRAGESSVHNPSLCGQNGRPDRRTLASCSACKHTH